MKMYHLVRKAVFCLVLSGLMIPFAAHAQNQVLGEVQLVGKTKADKTSGVWVDGQYVGYVNELKDNNKILLMPGEHEIAVRQSGYTDFRQKVVVEHLAHRNAGSEALGHLKGGEGCHLHRCQASGELTKRQLEG